MFTETESKIFDLLADGKTYREIAEKLLKTMANINAVCWRIRQKTGIKDTADPEQCRSWRRNNKYSEAQKERGPTPTQREVMWMLAQGMTLQQVADLRNVQKGCIEAQASMGRFRAGIRDTTRASLVAWFEKDNAEKKAMMEEVQKRFFPEKFFLNGDPCF